MEKIKVYLVEDDPIWAEGIAACIGRQSDMELVGTAGNRDTALANIRVLKPHAVLVDIGLEEEPAGGLELAKAIIQSGSGKVIMLTSMDERETILDCFTAGAVNYITKFNYKDVPEAVRSAHRNHPSLHPSCSEALREELIRLRRNELDQLLSPAERGILKMVHTGYTHVQISGFLQITERTIKNHMNRILKKLNCRNGREAAELAAKKGLLGKEFEINA